MAERTTFISRLHPSHKEEVLVNHWDSQLLIDDRLVRQGQDYRHWMAHGIEYRKAKPHGIITFHCSNAEATYALVELNIDRLRWHARLLHHDGRVDVKYPWEDS